MSLRPAGVFAGAASLFAARRPLVMLAVVASLVSACGDASPTAPTLDELSVRPRRTEYRCVAPSPDGDEPTVLPVPAGGGCPAGFDLIPWW